DAIAAAGGATADGNTGRLNLAAPLADGQQIVVPSNSQPASAPPSTSSNQSPTSNLSTPSPSDKININTASAEELEALPQIGPATAAKIVDYRTAHGPFKTIEEITNVKGIGPATFEKIKALITVESP
ncbi:MAG: helix-hairpin-helix domain-containing protein, partial [Chloroflexi bacterium]|nr:helix-hairpin-helix domain-containing protein [Chloroflexota bacterium]